MMYSRTPTCMRFYAHMYGDNIGSLTVLINKKDEFGTTFQHVAYSKHGQQSKNWFEVKINLPVSHDFSVSITLREEILAGRNFGGFGGFVRNPPKSAKLSSRQN